MSRQKANYVAYLHNLRARAQRTICTAPTPLCTSRLPLRACLALLAALLRLLLHFSARFVCARAEFVNFRQHQMQRVLQIHKKDSKRQKALKQKPEKCPQRLEVAASEHERSLQGEGREGREAKQQSSDYKGASVGKAQQIHTK